MSPEGLAARNRSIIRYQYSRLAALESIGGNAGAMSRAVNGVADVETGEIIELGNLQHLSAATRARIAAGRAAPFTIRERLDRTALTSLSIRLCASSAFAAPARTALEEMVAWMEGLRRVW